MRIGGDGLVLTKATGANGWLHATGGEQLTAGRHYWEVVLTADPRGNRDVLVGVARPGLDCETDHYTSANVWYLHGSTGGLYGNGKSNADAAGALAVGDRVGVLLDLGVGSLRFYRNGVAHGPGYPAGSVTPPVVRAVELHYKGQVVTLAPAAAMP